MSDGKSLIDGKFEIISALGAGGMGSVYLCRQIGMERMVAVKLLRNDSGYILDGEARARFEREAQTLSALRHKSIVSVYGAGVFNGLPYMAMEYAEGNSLSSLLSSNKPLSLNMVAQIAIQICEALECAHSHGIIHRDIKPNNIIVGKDGEVKLIDFGLAKLLPGADVKDQQLTEAGSAVGSVLYMSPEQCLGQPVDARSDIYCLGCVLHHCLTGVPPFAGDHSVSVMHQHVQSALPRLAEVVPDAVLPDGWQELLDVATAKEPRDRYQTTNDLLTDIRRLNDNLPIRAVSAPKVIASTTPRGSAGPWRSKCVMLVAASMVVGLAATVALNHPQQAPVQADGFAQVERRVELLQVEKRKLENAQHKDAVASARIDFALAELYIVQVRSPDILPAEISKRKALAEMCCIPPLQQLPFDEAFACARKMMHWEISGPAKAKVADLMLTRVASEQRTSEGDIMIKALDELRELCAMVRPRTTDIKKVMRLVCVHMGTRCEHERRFAAAWKCYNEAEALSDEPVFKVYCLARKDAISGELGKLSDTTDQQLKLFATIDKIDPPSYVMALNALLWNLDLHQKYDEYRKLLQQSCERYKAQDLDEPFCLYEAKAKLALNAGDWQGALTSWDRFCADLQKRKQFHGNATSVIFQQSYLLKALGQTQKSSERKSKAKEILKQDIAPEDIKDSIQNNSLVMVARALANNGEQQKARAMLNERIADYELRGADVSEIAKVLRFPVVTEQVEKTPDFVIDVMQPFVAQCKRAGVVSPGYVAALDVIAAANGVKHNYKEAVDIERQVMPLLETCPVTKEFKSDVATRLSIFERKLKLSPKGVRSRSTTSI